MQISPADRREHTRYSVPSFYTGVGVRKTDQDSFGFEGHAYDISVGGMRFDLDHALEPGDRIVCRIELPCGATGDAVDHWDVFVSATVVWVEDDDLEIPGPCRMACVFNTFVNEHDAARLERRLSGGRFRLAA